MRSAVVGSFCVLAACASGPPRGAGPGAGRQVDLASQSERLLNAARKKKNEQGCASAIPTYRVVSSFGKGHDTAQYELGACLFETSADSAAEQGLLRDEGLFWMRRAAWAGNARAQLALAGALSGADGHAVAGLGPDLVEGYGWALIYADNAAHKLYGLPDLHPIAAAHFRERMTAAMVDDAENFATDYRQLEMAVFTPPARERGAEQQGAQGRGPGPGGERRRPR
jgi:TPR repeat protein